MGLEQLHWYELVECFFGVPFEELPFFANSSWSLHFFHRSMPLLIKFVTSFEVATCFGLRAFTGINLHLQSYEHSEVITSRQFKKHMT